ncbi:MAG: transcription elongation factor GreB [Gammaproteobacteria bacterium]|nr:transcription elongation factor GreB [Gammaproteobacteria bacterium]
MNKKPLLQTKLNQKHYVTPTGLKILQDELNNLLRVQRPEVVGIVSWAAGNGDRSENGDYIYGKKRLREIDRRLRYLTKRIENAQVVDPIMQQNQTKVFFGATVTYLQDNGKQMHVTIVGIDEADPYSNKISYMSPVAKALLKSAVGDIVIIKTPAGLDEVEILKIVYSCN